jgi:hypothetical protein
LGRQVVILDSNPGLTSRVRCMVNVGLFNTRNPTLTRINSNAPLMQRLRANPGAEMAAVSTPDLGMARARNAQDMQRWWLRRPKYLRAGRSRRISTAKLTQLCGTTNRAHLRDAVEVVLSQEALRVICGSTWRPSSSRGFATDEASLPT